jgi:hypothetical protein
MKNSKYYDLAQTEIQAPPSSGFFNNETLGQSRKMDLQSKKWGSIPRNDSQRVIKQAICRMEFGVS